MKPHVPQEIEVGYGNWKLKLLGNEGLYMVTVALILVSLSWSALVGYTQLREDNQSLLNELQVLTYVISQPLDKRPALVIPPTLRTRMAGGS